MLIKVKQLFHFLSGIGHSWATASVAHFTDNGALLSLVLGNQQSSAQFPSTSSTLKQDDERFFLAGDIFMEGGLAGWPALK